MDKEQLTDYIKWLLSEVEESDGDTLTKKQVIKLLDSIIGEMYSRC